MLARLFCLLALLAFPGVARAQEPWTPPTGCVAKSWKEVQMFRDWLIHAPPDNELQWAREQGRWPANGGVWRWLERLYLEVDGGRVVSLVDCPFTDGLYRNLYERYDENGGFHIVSVHFYEDRFYVLVFRKTGQLFAIAGLPVWSPDRTRFAYGICSLMNGQDEIAISRISPEGLKAEIEGHMPCGLGACEIAWESNDTVAATCPKAGEQGNEHKVMRLTRRGASWTTTMSDR